MTIDIYPLLIDGAVRGLSLIWGELLQQPLVLALLAGLVLLRIVGGLTPAPRRRVRR